MPAASSTSRRAWPVGAALRESLRDYGFASLRADVLAGATVGIVAVPLAMALAIASGVAPQHGLYTAIVAGAVIAITGGSRYSISGPTAAFVVILLPITHHYGLGGLLVTTVMAGMILVAMGLARMGRLIQFIPYPVTTGFTAGIAVVIATLQVKDFLGLQVEAMPAHFTDKVATIAGALPTLRLADVAIGALTLAVLLLWPRLKSRVPGHLVALLAATVAAWAAHQAWPAFEVATIGGRFQYDLGGAAGQGVPSLPPTFVLPWLLPDAQGQPLGLSLGLLRELLPSAFTVAMLGAIESLLCAVVADGLTGARHDPNAELIGQGLGNIAAPFFGGMTATAAIARTATNVRTGARSPVAALVHALVVLVAVVAFAGQLGYLPMAALAALLLVVAWNMSEARHFANMLRGAPGADVAVLLTCFALTVLLDMVIAVGVGVALASVLFIQRMTALTDVRLVSTEEHEHLRGMPEHVAVYDVNGPLFFGAAEKAAGALQQVNSKVKVVILDMADVPMVDMTGIVALDSLVKKLNASEIAVVIANLNARIYRKLLKAGMRREPGRLDCCLTLAEARARVMAMAPAEDAAPAR